MYYQIENILQQYPCVFCGTAKMREGMLCRSEQGNYILKEYKSSEEKAFFLAKIMEYLEMMLHEEQDTVLYTTEGTVLAQDADGTKYMMRKWPQGNECDVKNRSHILEAVKQLGKVHQLLAAYPKEIPEYLKEGQEEKTRLYEKHTLELKRVKNYIIRKKQKNNFEREFLKHCDYYIRKAKEATQELQTILSCEIQQERLVHGAFHQHNVYFKGEHPIIVNYEKLYYGVQVRDFSNFLRKIMEKQNWNPMLGQEMLEAYLENTSLDETEKRFLYYDLSFPEKFWKIANHYMNTKKSWVNGRDFEKLEKIIGQEEEKQRFLSMNLANMIF